MAQDWTDDVFAAGHTGQTDLQNMENNFAAMKSLFSGAAQPASMAACHPWFDTTQHVLKIRDDGDSAWLGLMHGDTSQKLWIYRNAAMSGWAVDSGVTDTVLALKGGSVYTTGGASAGTWTQPDHTLTESEMPEHHHSLQSDDQYSNDAVGMGYSNAGNGVAGCDRIEMGAFYEFDYADHQLVMDTGGSGAHNHGTTYRPLAQVGIIATKN